MKSICSLVSVLGVFMLAAAGASEAAPSRAPAAFSACNAGQVASFVEAREAAKLGASPTDPAMCCALVNNAKSRCSIAEDSTKEYKECCQIRKSHPCTPDSANAGRGWPMNENECKSIGACMNGSGCTYRWDAQKNRMPEGFCMPRGGDRCPGAMYFTFPSANDQGFNCDGQRRFNNAKAETCTSALDMVAAAGCEVPNLPLRRPTLPGGDKLCQF